MKHLLLPALLSTLSACTSPKDPDTTEPSPDDFTSTTGPEHCGEVAPGEVWAADNNPHVITCTVNVEDADLMIAPGTVILVEADSGLLVSYYGGLGALSIEGTASDPVTFSSAETGAAGDWQGILLYENTTSASLHNVDISDAGGAYADGAIVVDGTEATLSSVTVSNTEDCGLSLADGGRLSADSSDLTLTGSDWPACADAQTVDTLPAAGSTYTGNTSDHVFVRGGTVDADVTWEDLGVPYGIDGSVYLEGTDTDPAVLTLSAGAALAFNDDAGLLLSYYGSLSGLRAEGTAEAPVTLSALFDTGRGTWQGVMIYDSAVDAELSLVNTTISSAGGSYSDANLEVEDAEVFAEGLTLLDAEGGGFRLSGSARFADGSSGLVVTGSESAGWTEASGAGSVPEPGAALSGNDLDAVGVFGGTISDSPTWGDLGVPYRVSDNVYLEGPSDTAAVLSITEGVTLTFADDAGLLLSYYGEPSGLVVEGTEAAPVLFTAADTEEAGAWRGVLVYDDADDTQLSLRELTIKFGGGSYSDANLVVDDATIAIDAVTFSGAPDAGFALTGTARFADGADGLTATGNGWAGSVEANSADSVPERSAISGNDWDGVEVLGGTVSASATWGDLGAPYWVTGNVYVEGTDADPAVLTLAAGASLAFAEDTGLLVSYYGGPGGLIADGDETDPVTFAPAGVEEAGAWRGLLLYDNAVDDLCVLSGVDIGYGGGSYSDGNIELNGVSATISASRIHNSAAWGIALDDGAVPLLLDISYADNASGDLTP